MPSTALTLSDLEFLSAFKDGEPAVDFARRHGYSPDWAKWKSKEVRRKLGGLSSLQEVVRMSEVTAEDFAALRREHAELKEALARQAEARTAPEREAARADVRDARESVDDELRRRGLTRADLDKLGAEKEYEKFKGFEERRASERAEEEARAATEEAARVAAEEAVKGGKGKAKPGVLDGLGGRRNTA